MSFRSKLPLSRKDGEAWENQSAIRADLDQTIARRNATDPTLQVEVCDLRLPSTPFGQGSCIRSHNITVSNPVYRGLVDKVTKLTADLGKLPRAYPSGLMRFRVLIGLPNEMRCDEHLPNNSCIGGTTLAEYRSTMENN